MPNVRIRVTAQGTWPTEVTMVGEWVRRVAKVPPPGDPISITYDGTCVRIGTTVIPAVRGGVLRGVRSLADDHAATIALALGETIPTQLALPSGLTIEDVPAKLDGLFSQWYEVYDAVPVRRDSTLRPEEIALCIMMNSRMSGNTGLAIWEHRAVIEAALQSIPADADLAAAGVPWEWIQALLDPFQSIPRAKLAVATKILHKKRPRLIPMLDTFVVGHYHPKLTTRAKTLGGYAVNLMKLFREDLLAVLPDINALCEAAERRRKPVTPVRMLDHLIWSVLVERQL